MGETEEEKNWYDEIVDEAESIMQQIEMGNLVIGSNFSSIARMAKHIQMFKSQPTLRNMLTWILLHAGWVLHSRKTWVPVSEDGEECDDGEVDLGDVTRGIKEIIGGVEGLNRLTGFVRTRSKAECPGVLSADGVAQFYHRG